jgi:hypothetical protein
MLMILTLCSASVAKGEISFVSGTNGVILSETVVDENGDKVFIFDGISEGQGSALTFSTDSACPGVAVTGGGEFASTWTCGEGVISASVVDRGGLSFGPQGSMNTFYVIFSNPPTPPGESGPIAALSGIQISVFGAIRSWNLDGSVSASGATFGVELSGPEGGEAHFRMDLPPAAVQYLGGVLGVFVGGKPYPFASVETNDDGSVSLDVDIVDLTSAGTLSAQQDQQFVTKKILAGKRVLSVGFDRVSVKSGKGVTIKVCAGTQYKVGDRIPITFTQGKKVLSLKKTLRLDSAGCGQSSVKLKSTKPGVVSASVAYKGKRAKAALKILK